MRYVANAILVGVAWFLTYVSFPVEPALILAALMALDFFSGLGRAHALKEQITSRRMKNGITSKLLLLIIPLVMALTAKGLGVDFSWLVEWSISVLILSEAYSIVANIYTVRTGVSAPEWDVISLILGKIRNAIDVIDKRK